MSATLAKKRFSRIKTPRPSIESESLTSFFVPWQFQIRSPRIQLNAQTGQIITVTEFFLFFVAVILLGVTLGLTAMSIWSLLFKFYYTFLDCSTELAYFAIPVALLCLPTSWICFSVHNDVKSRKFLSLVLVLLTLSIGVTVTAIYIGFTHKLNLTRSQIEKGSVLEEFRPIMKESMELYGKEGKIRVVWDEVQTKLKCCGVDDYRDWFAVERDIPQSCCNKSSCRDNSTSTTGCLRVVTATLALQTCMFSGINCVALFFQVRTATYVNSVKRVEE